MLAKAVGVLFSVSGGRTEREVSIIDMGSKRNVTIAGYLVGKEGPMIHSGAILGAGIPQVGVMICNGKRFI